jgi:peptide deformylase
MPEREIVTTPAEVLRKPARKVQSVSADVKQLIDDMIETMRVAPGVGLAAPQVGDSRRVIVVEFAQEISDPEAPPKPPKLYVLVNPEIVRHSREMEFGTEGCLSIPGYVGDVERYTKITVKGLNREGDSVKIKAKDWLARIFQHEIDHLEGVLFIDRATEVYRVEEGTEEDAERNAALPMGSR